MFSLPSKKSSKKNKNKNKNKKNKQSKNNKNATSQHRTNNKKRQRNHNTTNTTNKSNTSSGGTASSSLRKKQRRSKSSSLSDQFSSKLKGAQFRWLNEQLYTTQGSSSFAMFQKEPELFDTYHAGFREQAAGWRVNPLDLIIQDLTKLPKGRVVSDFGCGEARLARTLRDRHTIHSFDLVAGNELITACDIANVPLEDTSVDVAIFCLALMGPNYVDFLTEAWRVLRVGGKVKIAEVESRFIKDSDHSTLDNGIASFTNTLQHLGFKRTACNRSNDFFVLFEFEKIDTSTETSGSSSSSSSSSSNQKKKKKKLKKHQMFELKACRYKKR